MKNTNKDAVRKTFYLMREDNEMLDRVAKKLERSASYVIRQGIKLVDARFKKLKEYDMMINGGSNGKE